MNNDGICLLENVGLEVSPPGFQEWTLTRDGIEIKTRFEVKEKDAIRQITRGILTLEVNDKGERKELVSIEESKDFAPQELRSLVELSGLFEFQGLFKHLSLEPLQEKAGINMVLMQKRSGMRF